MRGQAYADPLVWVLIAITVLGLYLTHLVLKGPDYIIDFKELRDEETCSDPTNPEVTVPCEILP